jgi:hypothetical protein
MSKRSRDRGEDKPWRRAVTIEAARAAPFAVENRGRFVREWADPIAQALRSFVDKSI